MLQQNKENRDLLIITIIKYGRKFCDGQVSRTDILGTGTKFW